MRDKIWFMFLVLGLTAGAAGAALSFVKSKTQPIIDQRILSEGVKPTLDKFYGPIAVENDFIADRISLKLGKDDWGRTLSATVFKGVKGGKVVAAALQTSESGFGGELQVLTAFDLENKKILGVKTLDQKETKGLGSRIADDKESFIQQFKNMPFEGGVALKTNGGQVDSISGATVSSGAFTKAVNKAVDLLGKHADEINK